MLISWLLAAFPILLLVMLMIGARWGAARAGPAGWLAAAATALVAFGARTDLLAVALAKAFYQSLDVLLIVTAAYLLYRVVDEAGGVEILSAALPRVTTDRGMQALLIAWAFASFLQGVGGFGVPVVVTAPILAGLGFGPMVSIVAPSIGHAWSVTFGSLGSSFQALMATTGLPGETMAGPAAGLLGLIGLACGAWVAWFASGRAGLRRLGPSIIAIGLAMAVVQYALAVNRLWNVAGFGGGMAGLAVGLAVARRPSGAPAADVPKSVDIVLALVGYAALIVITFALVVVSPVREAMGRLVWQADFPETVTALGYRTPAEPGKAIVLLRHAGAALTYASAFSYVLYAATGRFRRGAAGRILISTGRGVLPSWIGIASMVSMVSIMTHAGMTDILARGLAAAAGPAFPVVAPWIGALGAFISGSNTSSNLLFGLLQRRTAELLGIAAAGVLAAQTAGGAIGSVVSPAKVAVGAASVGRQGSTVDEGAVLRSLLAPAAVLVALCSLIVVVLRWVGWG